MLLDWEAAGLVEWLGHVDDMPALLASADIVVLPSYREGLPKSLIEAAACARPLVTTDVPGCRDVVTDGVDGLLVPVCDVLALAQAIARLQDDRSLARRLGDAARAKALAEYDERRIVARTLDVYQELLSEPPTGASVLQNDGSRPIGNADFQSGTQLRSFQKLMSLCHWEPSSAPDFIDAFAWFSMASHAGEINEGQVIIERIDAMVTPSVAPVKT